MYQQMRFFFFFLSNEEKCRVKHIWCKWTATFFYQCKFYPQGCLPLQCALLPVHSSLLLFSYPQCLLQNDKLRIFWGFPTSYPQQPGDRQKESSLVIFLSYGPLLACLVMSQADKASLSVEEKVSKVTDSPNLVGVFKRQLVSKRKVFASPWG